GDCDPCTASLNEAACQRGVRMECAAQGDCDSQSLPAGGLPTRNTSSNGVRRSRRLRHCPIALCESALCEFEWSAPLKAIATTSGLVRRYWSRISSNGVRRSRRLRPRLPKATRDMLTSFEWSAPLKAIATDDAQYEKEKRDYEFEWSAPLKAIATTSQSPLPTTRAVRMECAAQGDCDTNFSTSPWGA